MNHSRDNIYIGYNDDGGKGSDDNANRTVDR